MGSPVSGGSNAIAASVGRLSLASATERLQIGRAHRLRGWRRGRRRRTVMAPAVRSRPDDFEMPTLALLPADMLVPPPHRQQNERLEQHDQQERLHDTLQGLYFSLHIRMSEARRQPDRDLKDTKPQPLLSKQHSPRGARCRSGRACIPATDDSADADRSAFQLSRATRPAGTRREFRD